MPVTPHIGPLALFSFDQFDRLKFRDPKQLQRPVALRIKRESAQVQVQANLIAIAVALTNKYLHDIDLFTKSSL